MKKILCLFLMILMCGCASQQPKFYQPIPVKTSDATYHNVKNTILIQQVILPAEVTRPQITTLGQNNLELKIDEFNRWGASPEKLVQRVINQNLSLYLPNANIENQTSFRKNYKYAIAVEITEMNGKLGHKAVLSGSYFIKNRNGITIKSGKVNESIAIENDYDSYVLAQSHLFGILSLQIALDLINI